MEEGNRPQQEEYIQQINQALQPFFRHVELMGMAFTQALEKAGLEYPLPGMITTTTRTEEQETEKPYSLEALSHLTTHELSDLLANVVLLLRRMPNVETRELRYPDETEEQAKERQRRAFLEGLTKVK